MNVLSLFDGMSCGQIALKELGVSVRKYYASEIDKFAITQTQHNFPDTIQLGNVINVDVSELDKIDLLIGGSPCQSFSFAGKRKGMSTKCNEEIYTLERYIELKNEGFEFEGQSFLFWEYMRILNDIRKRNPDVKFLLENVEMGNKWERVLSESIRVFGVHINSALVSAQNRKRIYWTNIKTKEVGLFGELHSDIPQPEDRGILLRDILENEVNEKYYISQAVVDRMNRKAYSHPKINPDKTGALNTKNNSGQMSIDSGTTFISVNGKAPTQRSPPGRSLDKKHNFQFIKIDVNGNPKSNQNKASCVTAGAHSGGNHSDMDLIATCDYRHDEGFRFRHKKKSGTLLGRARNDESCGQMICVAMRGRNPENPKSRKSGLPTEQMLEPNLSGKTNCLTSVQKDNLIMQLNQSKESGGKQPYQQNRVYDVNGIMPALNAELGGRNNITDGVRIRRLTPTECARLQTVPDWYEWIVSDTQIYKQCGNGWTIEVIKHILKFLKLS